MAITQAAAKPLRAPKAKTTPVLGLRLKFNLVLLVVFGIGMAVAAVVSHRLLEENAKREALRNADLMMEAALAIRGYTVQQIRPHLAPLLTERFLPQTVPAFAATETFQALRKKYPDFSYKEATLNPTNPRDRAAEWEADIITSFSDQPATQIITGERDTSVGKVLYVAHPIQVKDAACLSCHGQPQAAPPSLLKLYGESNGFGWKHGEIVGAQVIQVPLSVPMKIANDTFMTFMASLAAVFVAVFVVLNAMLSILIIRPITQMAEKANLISTGDFSIPEFADKGGDEITVLGASFNRMRRSLQKAMKLIKA